MNKEEREERKVKKAQRCLVLNCSLKKPTCKNYRVKKPLPVKITGIKTPKNRHTY
jgi:hypothetical protein